MSHTKLPRVCGLTVALALGLAGTASAADQTFKVPCAGPNTGPTATAGPQGLINRINQANTAPAGTKTTIMLTSGCAYVYRKADNTDGSDGDNALPIIRSQIVITSEGSDENNALIERSQAASTPRFRLFDVASNGNLTLDDITVAGGATADGGQGANAPDGGGILNKGALTLRDAVVTQNRTGNGGTGSSGATGGSGGNGGSGGGVANRGLTQILEHSTLSGNATGDGGQGGSGATGGQGGNGGDGAGLVNQGGGVLVRDDTSLTGNETGAGGMGGSGVATGGNGGNGGNGGGVATLAGGGVQLQGGNTAVDENVTGNGGSGGSGGVSGSSGNAGDGGGLFVSGTTGSGSSTRHSTVSADGTHVDDNTTGTPNGNGGGLAVEKGGAVSWHNGAFTYNHASGTGGAVYRDASSTATFSGTQFAGNTPNNCTPAGAGCPA